MTGIFAVSAALCAAAVAATQPVAPTIRYAISPVFKADALAAVDVAARFPCDKSGKITLTLPSDFAGTRELWRYVKDFAVEGASVEAIDHAVRMLSRCTRADVVIRYRVVSAYPHDPTAAGNPYDGAIIRPNWFSAVGEYLFAIPSGSGLAPAKLVWRHWPKYWKHLDNASGRSVTLDQLVETTLLSSPDAVILRRPILGGELTFGVLGVKAAAAAAYADKIASILSAQRRFWGDMSGPYTVTQIPLTQVPSHSSAGGTGRGTGFALYASTDIDSATMLRILAHEHTHAWIPGRIGNLPDKEEAQLYWFSEGFTDFYTARTLLKSDFWSVDEFVDELNGALREYAASTVKDATNAQIVAQFWKDPAMKRLPYLRGRLIAFLLDNRLRIGSAGKLGLDDLMFAMRDHWQAAAGDARPRALENLVATAPAELGLPQLLVDFVHSGHPIVLAPDLFGACASIETRQAAQYDPGFDRDASAAAGVIVRVDPSGPAFAAGLRSGMKRISRDGGQDGNPDVPLAYRIVDAQGERVISYEPRGKLVLEVQRVVLHSNGHSKVCKDVLSGERGGS
jgi:predicted metalloprotease with PDZ domain